jgi:hypothetical protein
MLLTHKYAYAKRAQFGYRSTLVGGSGVNMDLQRQLRT